MLSPPFSAPHVLSAPSAIVPFLSFTATSGLLHLARGAAEALWAIQRAQLDHKQFWHIIAKIYVLSVPLIEL